MKAGTALRLICTIARATILRGQPEWRDQLPVRAGGEGWEITLNADKTAFLSWRGRAWALPWREDGRLGLVIGESLDDGAHADAEIRSAVAEQNRIASSSRSPFGRPLTARQDAAIDALELVIEGAMNSAYKRQEPMARAHNPDPQYLRGLIARAGVSQQEAARRIGVSGRSMRQYLADPQAKTYQPAPYVVQYALEALGT